MAKKKKDAAAKNSQFNSSPFKSLKGFAVSAPGEVEVEQERTQTPEKKHLAVNEEAKGSFAEEMALLGVERLDPDAREAEEDIVPQQVRQSAVEGDDAEFLRAMGELQVETGFRDQLPGEVSPPAASAGRMKQLRRGKLEPEASLDLHGLQRHEVADKLRFFLQNAVYQGQRTLLLITGRGLHSNNGEPVLRDEAERFLDAEGRKWLSEWGRAPKQYGGDGALVLFMRKANVEG